jgi:hypothetical protein
MKLIYIICIILLTTGCASQTKDLKFEEKLEKELIKLKSEAFCDCYYEVTSKEPIKYKDGSTYVQIIDLNGEYVFGNAKYREMIKNWVRKEYKSYDGNNNLYLMKCLDFYNSPVLNKFIDSVRQEEIKLHKIQEGK